MKIKTLLITLAAALPLAAQSVVIEKPAEKLFESVNEYKMPHISPDGNYVLLAGPNYGSLYVKELGSKSDPLMLSDMRGSGWKPDWSPNSDQIAVRVEQLEKDQDITLAVKLFTPQGSEQELYRSKGDVSLPEWNPEGTGVSFIVTGGEIKTIAATEKSAAVNYAWDINGIRFSGEKSGAMSELPLPEGSRILAAELSPRGSRIALELIGKGIYVYDFETGESYLHDRGEYPCWINEDFLTYMKVQDNGHVITGAEVYAASYDETDFLNLTIDFNPAAMYPTVSRDGRVVFNTLEGEIYIMKIAVK